MSDTLNIMSAKEESDQRNDCGHRTPVTKSKKNLELLDLPTDILKCIFDHIQHPTHLHSSLMSCKALHALALPRLYTTLLISLSTLQDFVEGQSLQSKTHLFAAAFHRNNPGMRYVKNIWIVATLIVYYRPGFAALLVKLLGAVPEGQLERFEWGMVGEDMPGNIRQLLWQRQRNLRDLCVNTSGDDIAVVGQATSVNRVVALPRDLGAFDALSGMLRHCDKICEMEINAIHYTGPQARRDPQTNVVGDEVTAILFRHLEPGDKLDRLRELRLVDFDLRYSRQTWFRFLALHGLEKLEISYCDHADLFLLELIHQEAPKLKHFSLVHAMSEAHSDRTIAALEDFLAAIKGRLEHLSLVLRNVPFQEELEEEHVNAHRETLQRLFWDMRRTHGTQVPICYQELLEGCCKLTQLGINYPLHWFGEGPEYVTEEEAVVQELFLIFMHVRPRVLNLIVDPRLRTIDNERVTKTHERPESQLEAWATRIFDASRLCTYKDENVPDRELELVAFGTHEQTPQEGNNFRLRLSPGPVLFAEAQFKCLYREYRRACAVPWQDAIAQGLEQDILQYPTLDFDKASRAKRYFDWEISRGGWDEDDVWTAGNPRSGDGEDGEGDDADDAGS